MALDEDVEKPPERREVLLLRGKRPWVLAEVAADVAGGDLI